MLLMEVRRQGRHFLFLMARNGQNYLMTCIMQHPLYRQVWRIIKKLIDSLGAAGVNGNWPDAALRTGAIQNHQLTIYGGDEKSRYSISGNYFNQKGIVLVQILQGIQEGLIMKKIIRKILNWQQVFLEVILQKIN